MRLENVCIRRVYEPPSPDDGKRVLVDRLWPRGVRRENAPIDFWLKDVAPSDALRRRFGHDPARWDEFVALYHAELVASAEALDRLVVLCRAGKVTLLYAARDAEHNNAVALRETLRKV